MNSESVRAVERGRRARRPRLEARRLGRRVRIERGLVDRRRLPGQNPWLMTSCEYASRVIGSAPGRGGARRPEKRVTARSKLPQKKCTGLHLPTKPQRKLLEHGLHRDQRAPERVGRCRIVGPVHRCPTSNRIGSGTSTGIVQMRTSTPSRRSASITAAWKSATVRGSSAMVSAAAVRALRARARWATKSKVIVSARSPASSVGVARPRAVTLERDVPEMIAERRQCEADLADDLRPHVQRRVGVRHASSGSAGHASRGGTSRHRHRCPSCRHRLSAATRRPAPSRARPAGSAGRAKSWRRRACDRRACSSPRSRARQAIRRSRWRPISPHGRHS